MAKGGKDILRRIKSVKNTQQITKAMKMVAAARLRKSESRAQASRPYTDTLRKVMSSLSGLTGDSSHPYLSHINPDVRRVMLVLFSADKGLAGAFNVNLFRKAEEFMREQKTLGNEVELVTVGRKAFQYFRRRGWDKSELIPSFTNSTTYAEMSALTDRITYEYLGGSVSEVYLVYARYINVARNIPTAIRLLPIEAPAEKSTGEDAHATGINEEYELEPSPEALLELLLPRYFQTVLFQASIENFTAENASRMVAMENATKAAGDMIKDLTLQYNKARQSGITLELLDIVGGAEALKG
ncbi:MAG: ATP synthase F1 subunit gamma [bacterium]|nr:ATP synthase F1 subunit gamma [bacterium]